MSLRDLSLAGLEAALNQYLAMDPETPPRLAALHGRVIGIEFLGLGLTLYFIPDARGRLQLFSRYEGEPDCLMRGAPLDLTQSGRPKEGKERIFSGQVEILGNSRLGQEFGEILGGLDIDWEEHLSRITGDVAAHELGNAARAGMGWLRESGRSLGMDLGEYLQEEARLLPSRYELEDFYAAVDTARDDAERLAARIARLKSRPDGDA